jgi:hypothetical protein
MPRRLAPSAAAEVGRVLRDFFAGAGALNREFNRSI